ncbi:MAG TPA: nickel pincer cofactor biosynthesis protein LarB [Methanoregulaceae archaeon]|nr:nickel pincer cofactor biosynthesis protein LarB [Methanoregulaceae archaeon]
MIREILSNLNEGEISLEEAVKEIEGLRIDMVGEIARLDTGRPVRCGIPEVILAEGKAPAHLAEIAKKQVESRGRCIISRLHPEHAGAVRALCDLKGIRSSLHEAANMLVLARDEDGEPQKTGGVVGIVTAGTSDIGVAEEARVIAEEMGCTVLTAYDVGAAGIHRLFPAIRDLLDAHVFVVAAGREGTLPAVVAGLVDRPVIGVPVSSGYGYMGQGRAALASMLQSCSVIGVVNIDAGFTAGAFAARIANMVVRA